MLEAVTAKLTPYGISGAYPHPTPCSSYVLEVGDMALVMDLGSGSLYELLKDYYLADLRHVFISHFHHDHSSDLGSLLYTRILHPELPSFNLYTPPDEGLLEELARRPGVRHHVIRENEGITIGEMAISFLRTNHPEECYAIKVQMGDKTLVYGADGAYSKEFSRFCKDVDLLILEYSLFKYPVGDSGHMDEISIVKLLRESQPKRTLLTHLWRDEEPEFLLEAITSEVDLQVEIIQWKKPYQL